MDRETLDSLDKETLIRLILFAGGSDRTLDAGSRSAARRQRHTSRQAQSAIKDAGKFQHAAEPGTQGRGRGEQDVRAKAAQAARRGASPATSQSEREARCIRRLLPALRRFLFRYAAVRLRGL